jgi:long-subunit fatty acid transport protein
VNDRLWLGAEITPMLGYLRNIYRYGVPFHYKLVGPGIQGMVGATYKPTEHWSLGLSLRTPGKVWMDGSDEAPSGGRQDVNLEVKLPTQLAAGAEHLFTDKLRVMVSVRYTDSSKFGDSDTTFDKMPGVTTPFIPDALDEWRYAIGTRYAWTEHIEMRGGFAYSNRIVGANGVSPLVYDNNHFVLSGGAGYTTGPWTFEFVAGFVPYEDRKVHQDQAAMFPGTFESGGAEIAFGLQRRF